MEKENKSSVQEIMQNRSAAETSRREIDFIEKTGNLTVDVYNNYPPKALGIDAAFKDPKVIGQNSYLMMQNAVLTGCHNEPNGNCYVSKASIDSKKSDRKLRDGVKMEQAIQVYWDESKDSAKDKSRYTEVVNASKLEEKFVSHNKSVSLEEQEKAVAALAEKAFENMETGARKDGLPTWDAAKGKDVVYIPDFTDKVQKMRDTVAMAAARIVGKDLMAGPEIRFNREVTKAERVLLKHFVAAEIRTRMGLGADERNGLNRESAADRKEVVGKIKSNERLLGNAARRARGIVNKVAREFDINLLKGNTVSKAQEKAKDITKGDNGKSMGE